MKPQYSRDSKTLKQQRDTLFSIIVQRAVEGRRFPTRTEFAAMHLPYSVEDTKELCNRGQLYMEVVGQNWRQAIITDGEHAGKRTAWKDMAIHPGKSWGVKP